MYSRITCFRRYSAHLRIAPAHHRFLLQLTRRFECGGNCCGDAITRENIGVEIETSSGCVVFCVRRWFFCVTNELGGQSGLSINRWGVCRTSFGVILVGFVFDWCSVPGGCRKVNRYEVTNPLAVIFVWGLHHTVRIHDLKGRLCFVYCFRLLGTVLNCSGPAELAGVCLGEWD